MKNLTNEQLVAMWQESEDDDVLEQIINNMQGIIWQKINNYGNIPNLDKEDIQSELVIKMVDVMRSFDATKGVKFTTYCSACLEQHLNRLFRKMTSKKRYDPTKIINSLEDTMENHLRDRVDENGDLWLSGVCKGYEEVVFRDTFQKCGLTDREKIVVALMADGYLLSEIAKILGITPAGVTWIKRGILKKRERGELAI